MASGCPVCIRDCSLNSAKIFPVWLLIWKQVVCEWTLGIGKPRSLTPHQRVIIVWSAQWWPGLSQDLGPKLVTRDAVSSREWVELVTVTTDKVWNICFVSLVVFTTRERFTKVWHKCFLSKVIIVKTTSDQKSKFRTLDKSEIRDIEDDEVGVLPQPPCPPGSGWRPAWPGPLSLCPLSVLAASHSLLCSGKWRLISSDWLYKVN